MKQKPIDIRIDPVPVKIVTVKQLGRNCWLAERFVGGRCERVEKCDYPEKKTCKAVDAEIAVLEEQLRDLTDRHLDDNVDNCSYLHHFLKNNN